ncbi:MAG TPA: NBR1-Ig-like domain-containing protein, partial [Levilinea sp.]|nr:NBR1-Ig-like domain-containing protein [Levilinea sp.]
DLEIEKKQALYPARSGTKAILQVKFQAPSEPGTYRSVWQAARPDGEFFGDQVYVEFVVR